MRKVLQVGKQQGRGETIHSRYVRVCQTCVRSPVGTSEEGDLVLRSHLPAPRFPPRGRHYLDRLLMKDTARLQVCRRAWVDSARVFFFVFCFRNQDRSHRFLHRLQSARVDQPKCPNIFRDPIRSCRDIRIHIKSTDFCRHLCIKSVWQLQQIVDADRGKFWCTSRQYVIFLSFFPLPSDNVQHYLQH